jgi:nitrite reductase (NADH) small subunit
MLTAQLQLEQLDLNWRVACPLDSIIPNMGVAALINGIQIAIFRLPNDEVYAISNYDPFSKAFVLSRGIVGDRKGELKVASPIFKQSFSLVTGQCLDDPNIRLATYAVRVVNGCVEIGL